MSVKSFSNINDPDGFLRFIHPDEKGNIIVQRNFAKKKLISRTSAKILEPAARSAVGEKDIFMSISSFTGRPLLLNFQRTNCLYIQVKSHKEDESKTYMSICKHLSDRGIPLPNIVLSDGERLDILWHLSEPFTRKEVFDFIACQNQLYNILSESKFKIVKESNSPSHLIRLIGTVNSRTGYNACVIRLWQDPIPNERILSALYESVTKRDFDIIQKSAYELIDMELLFREKVFEIKSSPKTYSDWVMFFAAPLGKLCTEKQLREELKALAESLENTKWELVTSEMKALVSDLSKSASSRLITIGGSNFDTTTSHWRHMAANLLNVNDNDVQTYGLSQIIPETSKPKHKIINVVPEVSQMPFGNQELVPLNRLLLKKVA